MFYSPVLTSTQSSTKLVEEGCFPGAKMAGVGNLIMLLHKSSYDTGTSFFYVIPSVVYGLNIQVF